MVHFLRSTIALAAIAATVASTGAMTMEGSMSMDGSMMMNKSSMAISASTKLKLNRAFDSLAQSQNYADRLELIIDRAHAAIERIESAERLSLGKKKTLAQLYAIVAMAHARLEVVANSEAVMVGGAPMIRTRDIVDNAVLASNVTTVVAAVQAAGLVNTLKSEGPFTVFAPTNDAFALLPAGTVETLVKPENKGTLTNILTYHVVAGKYKIKDLKDGMELTTVQGGKLKVTLRNGHVYINDAMIETRDVISSNGVTHVIDRVMVPGAAAEAVLVGGAPMVRTRDIVENAVLAPNVTTVVAAVGAAGLVDTLKSDGPFTVFAPDNAAFAKLPSGTVETLLKPENKGTLVKILTYHVVAGKFKAIDLKDGMVLTTVQGDKLTVRKSADGKVSLVDAKGGVSVVATADVISSNGVTHVIDTVLMPN